MKQAFFLQPGIPDPYAVYHQLLQEKPVFWDGANNCWVVCSYAGCLQVLGNSAAHIPAAVHAPANKFNKYALLIKNHVARFRNPPQHQVARQAAVQLYERLKYISIPRIMDSLAGNSHEIDWVNTIGKKLPALAILQGFEFSATGCETILPAMSALVKIMLPNPDHEQIALVNDAGRDIYLLAEKHLTGTTYWNEIINSPAGSSINRDDLIAMYISNMIGLLIQSYDAGRGLLSNVLLQVLLHEHDGKEVRAGSFIQKSIIETLRYDPPVHNTKRVATSDFIVQDADIKKGDNILVVLAAANRDPKQFINPGLYDINRGNNHEHLTFGAGSHRCIANQFSTNMAGSALTWLFDKYKEVRLMEKGIGYEPLMNMRLPKEIMINLV